MKEKTVIKLMFATFAAGVSALIYFDELPVRVISGGVAILMLVLVVFRIKSFLR